MLHGARLRSEQGSSLVITILLLLIVSGLAAAMISSSTTDTMVSRNSTSAAQAQAAAEAGLNHAIDAVRTYLRNWEANFTNTNDAVSRVLRGPDDLGLTPDDGSLAWLPGGTPTFPTVTGLAGLNGVSYNARVFDDDDVALQNNWLPADLIRNCEGTGGVYSPATACVAGVVDPVVDHNGVFVVRATGFAADNTSVTVEAVMKPLPWPAVVTNGDLDMSGNPTIDGEGGSVHANGNVTAGGSTYVEYDVTAVGTVMPPSFEPDKGEAEGGQLPITIPPVNVADYLYLAKYRLGSDGNIYLQATGVALCTPATCGAFGFNWTSSPGSSFSNMAGIVRTWDPGATPDCAGLDASLTAAGVPAPDCGQGVYYAEASDVRFAPGGGLGKVAGGGLSPYKLSVLVDGTVRMAGNPVITPGVDHPNILIVANGDLSIIGTVDVVGQVRVREQFDLSGTMILHGQIIVESRTDLSNEVTGASKISGTATVTNDRLAVYDYGLAGWREFRR